MMVSVQNLIVTYRPIPHLADAFVFMVEATDNVDEASGNVLVCVNSGVIGILESQLVVYLESSNIEASEWSTEVILF